MITDNVRPQGKSYHIFSAVSGADFGIWYGASAEDALATMAAEAGLRPRDLDPSLWEVRLAEGEA